MWYLDNRTPYAAERTWLRDKTGHHHWVVAVKGTFEITPHGDLCIADDQPPPALLPEHHGDPSSTSLRFDSDLVPRKPTTEVLVNAYAYAPQGKPATSVPVSLRVGPIQKTILVHGPRVYYHGAAGLTTTAPQPFECHPIRYEDAYGGSDLADSDPRRQHIDLRNPIGKGVKVRSADLVNTPAHRIEYPQGDPSKLGPAGLGPLSSYWSPRLELAGTYDDTWAKTTKPLLPADYDERFTLCAPLDQRAPTYFQGGEPVSLINMTRDGVLHTVLPKIELVHTTRIKARREQHRGTLVTIILEPEQRHLMLVWHTNLPVAATEIDHLAWTTIEERRVT